MDVDSVLFELLRSASDFCDVQSAQDGSVDERHATGAHRLLFLMGLWDRMPSGRLARRQVFEKETYCRQLDRLERGYDRDGIVGVGHDAAWDARRDGDF